MKDPKKARSLNLLVAFGVLYLGTDRLFMDGIRGGDTLDIWAGALQIACSIIFFVVAWRAHKRMGGS
jgi:hypothetical protein